VIALKSLVPLWSSGSITLHSHNEETASVATIAAGKRLEAEMEEDTTSDLLQSSSATDVNALVRLEGVSKEYEVGDATVYALRGVSLDIPEGQFVVLLGPSGSGKTTLLNLVGGLDAPSRGRIWVGDSEITDLDESSLTMYRRNTVGFVFQFFNLVPSLTAGENVEMVAELTGNKDRATPALRSVGLSERIDHFPAQLSGGEQQRVAIARALAKGPSILLGDEPTGDLDYDTGKMILGLMRSINRSESTTMLIVTHNVAISRMADRVIRMRSGEIVEDTLIRDPIRPEDLEW